MNEEEYLKERLEDQIKYYEQKSKQNKICYLVLQSLVLTLSASIPLLSGFNNSYNLNIMIGVIGFLVVAFESIILLFKYRDNWVNYRTTAETIKHEKYLFLTKSGLYKNGNSFDNFVERIENLISTENTKWIQYINKEHKSKK